MYSEIKEISTTIVISKLISKLFESVVIKMFGREYVSIYWHTCKYCGKDFYEKSSSRKRIFCSKSCWNKYYRGERSLDVNFFKQWTEEMAYILGYIAADGCISRSNGYPYLMFASIDKDIILKVRKVLKSTHKIRELFPNGFKGKKQYHLSIGAKDIWEDLESLGITERKSLTLKFPSAPKEYQRHFIRGYFDGDGYITKCEDRDTIGFLGTYDFISTVENIFRNRLNIREKKIQEIESGKLHRINYYTREAFSILEWMYKDSNIYLDRKYNKYKEMIAYAR